MSVPTYNPTCIQSNSCQNDLQEVRAEVLRFVNERNWKPFHTPKNLLLALCGEVGELCEIFQWRPEESVASSLPASNTPEVKDKPQIKPFVIPESDLIHLGEEISDVFIYSLRLAEICQIDLGLSINHVLGANCLLEDIHCINEKFYAFPRPNESSAWTCVNFDFIYERLVQTDVGDFVHSARNCSLKIQTHIGAICSLFYNKDDADCEFELKSWSELEIKSLAASLGEIILLLFKITNNKGLSMKYILLNKIAKNAKKYPVHLAKGSSSKYTDYIASIKSSDSDEVSLKSRARMYLSVIGCIVVGLAFRKLAYIYS